MHCYSEKNLLLVLGIALEDVDPKNSMESAQPEVHGNRSPALLMSSITQALYKPQLTVSCSIAEQCTA
jgi:hypothetical protein